MVAGKSTLAPCLALLLIVALPWVAGAQIVHVPTETPEQGRAFSEFNHRMAGVFLLAIGLLAVGSHASPRLSFLGQVWPSLFLLPGLYLVVMSDPEVWPMGTQTWVRAFQVNAEARQHKIFALLMIAMGILEFLRARGKLHSTLGSCSFPALAVFGGILLFFHPHNADEVPGQSGSGMAGMSHKDMGHQMPGMNHETPGKVTGEDGHVMTETMLKIQNQHFWFSMVGFAVAFLKFLHDGNFSKKPFVPYLWPSFISLLGLLLILYAE